MTDSRKKLVSVRLCHTDIERIKAIAGRLRVRESEVIRFALRLAFARLEPLHDPDACGRDLIPIFIKYGPELMYHFDLDSRTLESIINSDLDDPQKKVDSDDIELLTIAHNMPGYHLRTKLKELPQLDAGRLDLSGALQQYLYEKYIHPRDPMEKSLAPESHAA